MIHRSLFTIFMGIFQTISSHPPSNTLKFFPIMSAVPRSGTRRVAFSSSPVCLFLVGTGVNWSILSSLNSALFLSHPFCGVWPLQNRKYESLSYCGLGFLHLCVLGHTQPLGFYCYQLLAVGDSECIKEMTPVLLHTLPWTSQQSNLKITWV